jgi:hypothetical protein
MPKLNKKKKKSKSMVNKRFRRNRKKTIKLNRKFQKRRSRRRRRQRGGAWYSAITNFFGKKKEPEFIGVQDIPPTNPAAVNRNTFFNQMGKQYTNLKDVAGGLAQKTTDAVANVTNIMNKPELKAIDRSALTDFEKLEVDFKKLKDQFGVIGEWITKRTKDPTKCPCCKQIIPKAPGGKGVPEQQPPQPQQPPPPQPPTPATQSPVKQNQSAMSMEELNNMMQMNPMQQ